MTKPLSQNYDLFIIGGGINGCGIARDAAGRGLKVGLAEMNDLASATSSASTKLFHGGLRYLEYFEFRLVREALVERETLLRAMPHISWPMRFVLPYHRDMRFDVDTPTSQLLTMFMPWMKGSRPAWLIRLGLFLYDNLGGRKILPGTRALNLHTAPEGRPLQAKFRKAYEYSDCWIQDSRLVVLNARDAAARGATIMTRTKVVDARFADGLWQITLQDSETGKKTQATAKMLVNAGGPWVEEVIHGVMHLNSSDGVRLVRGSHIVVKRLYDGDKCYFFQGEDGRIIFAIPYEQDFTLIGTTDADHPDAQTKPVCTEDEAAYLCRFASEYFEKPVRTEDVVWTYSGVRPLYNDGASSATAATRDYVLRVDTSAGGPVLNVFGGKITTYRRLAESALDKINQHLSIQKPNWTAGVALPGGAFDIGAADQIIARLASTHPYLDEKLLNRLWRTYGTETEAILQGAKGENDLGESFGAGIYARELDWAVRHEWVRSAEDFAWRRTRMGLQLTPAQIQVIDQYIIRNRAAA